MGQRKLGFERIASIAAVRTRGDFGIIPSPDSKLEIYVELCGKVLPLFAFSIIINTGFL